MPTEIEPRGDATMWVVPWWIETHCVIPDGFHAGQPFRLYEDQLLWFANYYLVRGDAVWDPTNPLLSTAFRYRRGLEVGPQKLGKSPKSAAHICVEGVGPSVFAGWAEPGDRYVCVEHGCGCGAVYEYEPGEPKGMLRPTPYVQIIAVSEDQTDNVYRALRPMIEKGPLRFLMPKTGEDFIRLPGDGLVEPVTSSATSRIGGRSTFVLETEAGLYTKRNGMRDAADALHRNLAGMQARAAEESNAWNPAENSTAQLDAELAAKMGAEADIYVQFRRPPANLSFANKVERRKILRHVYPADVLRENGGHVDLDAIDAEIVGMLEHDAAGAARFFGNILVKGAGAAFDIDVWKSRRVDKHEVPAKALITIGFDGSRRRDHTAMIATEVASGYQWPLGIWRARDYGGEIPRDVVEAVLETAIETFDVWRVYADPPYWEDTISSWQGRFGKERVHEWFTHRIRAMAYAIRGWNEAIITGALSHCAEREALCRGFTEHVGNAVRRETGYRDDGGALWTVEKPSDNEKIDSVPAAVLSWEARNDAIAADALSGPAASVYESRGFLRLGRQAVRK